MLTSILDFLSPILGWAGIGSSVVAGALVAAWFLPGFRRLALEVAVIAAVATSVYWKGHNDGSERKQEQWDAAIEAAYQRGAEARSGAERDIGNEPAGRVPNDRFNRDQH